MSHAPTDALKRRLAGVRAAMEQDALDALVVTALPNILYLTNFTGSSAILIVTRNRLLFLTDFRYVTAIESTRGTAWECAGAELVVVEGSYDAALSETMVALPARRIGFEAAHLTVSRHAWIASALARRNRAPDEAARELVGTEHIVERARVRKDAYEVALLREGARRLSIVARGAVDEVRAGRTELDVAAAIDRRMRAEGFSKPAFDTIVAGGPNSALPHARPGERRLAEGDLVVLDFGGVHESYCVDMTRTVVLGRADSRTRHVYEAVRRAHARAIAAVAPGRSRFDIDAAARDSLAGDGLAEAFGHGTGHGLGIEVHEDPRIARRRADVDSRDEAVEPGMVFTIEPGAYLPDWGGVRIEDDVLVTETGAEVLTEGTTELIEV